MKVNSFKKAFSVFLALVMLLSMVPISASISFSAAAEVRTDGKVLKTDICKIGDQGYETFQDAVSAAPTNGTETLITLLKSVYSDGTTTIKAGQNITLELNGKTVAFDNDAPNAALFSVKSGAILTIQDQTDTEKNGTGRGQMVSYAQQPDMKPCPGYASNCITNYGTVNVKSGLIANSGEGGASYPIDCQAIHASGDVAVNITGGRVESYGNSVGIRMYTSKTNSCDVSITGGVVSSLWVQNGSGTDYAQEKGSLTIKKPAVFLNNLGVTCYNGYPEHFAVNIEDVTFGSDVQYDLDSSKTDNQFSVKGIKAYSFSMRLPAKVLSDGYFMSPVDPKAIVDGYVCIVNPDKDVKDAKGNVYNYKICKVEDVPEDVEYGARVINASGTSYHDYYTLADAMSAVNAGETVQLLLPAVGTAASPNGKAITVDLNDQLWTSACLDVYGPVTVKDSSEAQTGKMIGNNFCIYVNGYASAYGYIENIDVVVESGTFEAKRYPIYTYYDYYGSLTINGGTFTPTADNQIACITCEYYTPSITINGGTFNGDVVKEIRWSGNNYSIYYDYVRITVNDGVFNAPINSSLLWTINGGTFNDLVYLKNYYYYNYGDAYGTYITDGEFADDVWNYFVYNSGLYYLHGISGGVFAVAPNADLCEWSKELAEGYTYASNTDEDTMALYPYTVKPLQIDLIDVSVDEETGEIIGMEVSGVAEGDADEATAAVEAITETQRNQAVGLFADTNLENAFAGEKKDASSGYSLSIMLDAIKQLIDEKYDGYDVTITDDGTIQIVEKSEGGETVKTETRTDADVSVKVKVDAKAATVEVNSEIVGDDTVKTAIINTETFDVKPTAKTTISVTTTREVEITDPVSGETTTDTETVTNYQEIEAPLSNDDIKEAIAFRLPISKNTPAGYTAVYHSDDINNVKKDYLGMFPIITDPDTGDKYIQLEAMSFSYYTIENMNGITTTNVVAIKENDNYRGFDTLVEGIADYNKDAGKVFLDADFSGTAYDDAAAAQATVTVYENTDGDGKFYLTENFSGTGYESEELAKAAVPVFLKPADESLIILKDMADVDADFDSKAITLDLNGLYFIGEVTKAENVTVINSDALNQETLGATGQYGVNVSAFVADGYGTKKTAINDDTVVKTTADAYKVVVVTSTKTDRDPATDDVDVYAFDNVTVEVRVYGPRFVAADITLTYDDDNFEINEDYDTPSSWSEKDNHFRYHNAKAKSDEQNYFVPDKVDEEGKAYYSLGTWVFTVLDKDASEFDTDEAGKPIMHVPFQVKSEEGEGEYIRDTYVSGAWKDGWSSNPADKLDDAQLVNDYANIRLIDMAVTVNPATGLVFKNTDQALFIVAKPYTATANGAPVKTTTTLETCVLTSEEVASGMVPTDDDYIVGLPEALNADTYTVYYKVSAPGYVTVTGSTTVTIAPKDIDVKWTIDDEIGEDFTITYSESGGNAYAAPNAWFQDVDGHNIDKDGYNSDKTIYTEIKLIQVDEMGITGEAQTNTLLQKVGKYTYQVRIVENGRYSKNYNILTGDTQVVTIEGGRFSGYTLTNGNEGQAVYYDQASHVPAKLNVADVALPAEDEATVTYYWKQAGVDTDWHEGNAIPTFTEMGTYILKAKLTADSYYDHETDPVYFTIKPVDYKVETFEWVAGWSVVLVYTNEDIPGFTYDGTLMFNMDGLGYKFGSDLAADGSRGNEEFNHVFGIVVFGAADTTLVVSSNDNAKSINNVGEGGAYDSRYDVNHNNSVLIDDYVAVQGTYNVEKTYFDSINEVVISDTIMQTVLKADVNGDKIVDTYDIALIKANSDNN